MNSNELYKKEIINGLKVAWYFRWVLYFVALMLSIMVWTVENNPGEAKTNLLIIAVASAYNLLIYYFLKREKHLNPLKYISSFLDVSYISLHVWQLSIHNSGFAVITAASLFIYFILIFLAVITLDRRNVVFTTVSILIYFNLLYIYHYPQLDSAILAQLTSATPMGQVFKSVYLLAFGLLMLYVPGLIKRLLDKQALVLNESKAMELSLVREKEAKKFADERLALEEETKQMLSEQNEELRQQNEEIEAQKEEIISQSKYLQEALDIINKKNKDINDSIQYAKRIQKAIMHTPDEIEKLGLPVFVLLKPRDVVSGDFYWISEINHNNKAGEQETLKVVICADCTGHGVPGGFMTVLGKVLLDDILNLQKITSAQRILLELDDAVKKLLQRGAYRQHIADGMDISIVLINTDKNTLEFAGAHQNLYLFTQQHIQQIKGENCSIGGSTRKKCEKKFNAHKLSYQKGDRFFLCSDGYYDQIGGAKARKLMRKQFVGILEETATKPLQDQKQEMEETLDRWMINPDNNGKIYEQVDDVLLIGVELI